MKIHFQKIHFLKIHFQKKTLSENTLSENTLFRKYTFRKYTFRKYIFGKYTFRKYTFRTYTFRKYTFGKYTCTFHFSLFTQGDQRLEIRKCDLWTDRRTWVGARDTCVSKNIVTMHRLHDVLLFFKTSIKNRIVKNREEIDKKSHR